MGTELFHFFNNKHNRIISVSSKIGSEYDYKNFHLIKSFKSIDIVFVMSGFDESNSINLNNSIRVKKKVLDSLLRLSRTVKVKKIFYFSSVKVYSDKLVGKISENTSLFSNSVYSKAHLFAEKYLKDNYKNLNYTILRLSNVYGSLINSDKGNKYILNSLLKSIKNKKKFKIKSKVDFYRDFISIDYFLYVIQFIIDNKIRVQLLNLCAGKMSNILDVINKLRKIHKKKFNNYFPIYHNISLKEKINRKFSTSKLERLNINKLKYFKLSKYI